MSKLNLVTGDIVSFTVHPNLFLKINQSDLVYQGEISAELCSQFETNAAQEWIKMYPSLPSGVVNDPNKYPWLLFKNINGKIVVVNEAWIDVSTLVSSGSTVIWVTEIKGNNLTPEIIRTQLATVGVEVIRTYSKGA